MLFSAVRQRVSIIHIYAHCFSCFPHYGISSDIKYIPLYYAVIPYFFPILYIIVCIW